MKRNLLLKTLFLLCALVVGSSNVWAQKMYKKVTSDTELVDGAKYLIVTTNAYSNASDPVVESQYLTIGKVNDNNRTGVQVSISGDVATANVATASGSELAHEIKLVASGDNWNLYDVANEKFLNGGSTKSKGNNNYLKTAASVETSTGQSKNNGVWTISISDGVADIKNGNNFHLRFNPNILTVNKVKVFTPRMATYNNTNYATYPSVSLYKEITEPASALDGVVRATITYSGGTFSSNTWTMTDNSDYTFFGTNLSKKSGTEYFKLEYGDDDYTISVPSTVAIAKFVVKAYGENNGSTLTYGSDERTFSTKLSTETYTISSPEAGHSISFKVGTKNLVIVSIDLLTADGITLTTTNNMDGWRTFYDASQDYEVDANTKIYVARTQSTAGVVSLTALDATKIPATSPVILKTSAADHKLVLTKTTGATSLGENKLRYAAGTAVDGYRMGYKSTDGIGFYKYTATAPASGVVYIGKDNVVSSAHEFLAFSFDNETTGIANLNVDVNDNFDANAPMYNLAGQRVNKNYKGVIIQNGRKYLNK